MEVTSVREKATLTAWQRLEIEDIEIKIHRQIIDRDRPDNIAMYQGEL